MQGMTTSELKNDVTPPLLGRWQNRYDIRDIMLESKLSSVIKQSTFLPDEMVPSRSCDIFQLWLYYPTEV